MCSTHIQRCHVLVWLGDIPEERSVTMMRKNWFVRSGIWTHALIRGPEFSQIPIKEPRQCLESGALDHSAILTLTFCSKKKHSSHLGIEPRTFGLEVQRAILCANGTISYCWKKLAERSFDLRTSGLWAQHASTAPLCYGHAKRFCQKWDSNSRPQKWTATWTQRLRPLGHPDLVGRSRIPSSQTLSVTRPYGIASSCSPGQGFWRGLLTNQQLGKQGTLTSGPLAQLVRASC